MTQFLQYTATGLAGGLATALLALGVVMIYRSTRVLSFTQGAIASLSTYVYYQFATVWDWAAWAAMPVALVASVGTGAVIDLFLMRPLRKADALTRTVATLGGVLVILAIIRVTWKGGETFVRPLSTSVARFGAVTLGWQQLIAALPAAISEDPAAARLLGVNPARASALAWILASALAALAGILVTPLLVLNPFQMTLLMVGSYAAALLGGFLSLPLTLAGAALIGAGESLTTGYVHVSGLPETFGFIAVFAVLLLLRGREAAPSLGRGSW